MKCTRCNEPNDLCSNCWMDESRISQYLKSEDGRNYLRNKLDEDFTQTCKVCKIPFEHSNYRPYCSVGCMDYDD